MKGRILRRLAGALIGLGVIITFWSRIPLLGVPLFLGGVILAVWAWKFD